MIFRPLSKKLNEILDSQPPHKVPVYFILFIEPIQEINYDRYSVGHQNGSKNVK
jgi:hypothetical protein